MRPLATVLSMFTLAAWAQTPADADVYAVVVGYNGGLTATSERPELSPLRYADDDALRMARWFELLATPAHVWVLTEPDETTRAGLQSAGIALPKTQAPTRANLFATLDAVQARLARRTSKRPAVLYFFYAGHGLTGRMLLAPEGTEESGLTGHELRVRLAALELDRVDLFIDACRSQSLFVERGGPDLSAEIDALENRGRRAVFGVITATQSDKPAGEASDLQGGFFSHVLASGLAGAADVNGDELVSFGELAAFVAFNTERLTGQRPWFEAPAGDLRAPVVDLRGSSKLELAPEVEGRMRVVSSTGAPVFAEVNKAKGRSLSLTLPAGRYQVQHLDGANRARVAMVDVVAAETSQLSPFGEPTALPHVAERGDVDWQTRSFQTPFSLEAVAALETGFVAGREPPLSRALGTALDASYVLAPAPFGLPGVEQGAEIGARFHLGGLLLGGRIAARASTYSTLGTRSSMFRLGVHAQAGWRFLFFKNLFALSGSALVGFKTIVLGAHGDPLAPSIGADVRAELFLSRRISAWLDGRFEAAWVNLDGTRLPFAEPSLLVGVSVWL